MKALDCSYEGMYALLSTLSQYSRKHRNDDALNYIKQELETITEDEWNSMARHPATVGYGSFTTQLCRALRNQDRNVSGTVQTDLKSADAVRFRSASKTNGEHSPDSEVVHGLSSLPLMVQGDS